MEEREQWSAIEKAILAKEDLQNVLVTEESNIWDYLDGIAEDESQELRERMVGK